MPSETTPTTAKETTPTSDNDTLTPTNEEEEATPTRDEEVTPDDDEHRETTPIEEEGVARRPEVRTVRFSEDVEHIEISNDSSDHRDLVQVEISENQRVRERE